MSPTVLRIDGYRIFFFSREEPRMHVHVQSGAGEAKVWLEPDIELATSAGYHDRELNKILKLIEENAHEIREAWQRHFGG